MKLSERVGFALEHLILIELEKRNIKYIRSEQITNEAIKSDISITIGNSEIVLFVTHTRTQGMTNRKFYRTFEELAQRRLARPHALCVEIALVRGRSKVRAQQDHIFSGLFDGTFDVATKESESEFVSFVKNLGSKLSLEVTKKRINEAPKEILNNIHNLLDNIIALKRTQSNFVGTFWQYESEITKGNSFVKIDQGISIKLGMKMLSLLNDQTLRIEDFVNSQFKIKPNISPEFLNHLIRTGISSSFIEKSIGGPRMKLSSHVVAAATFCKKKGIKLINNWYEPYLKTQGSKRLREDLMDFDLIKDRNASIHNILQSCHSSERLAELLVEDYHSEAERCDLFDMAIRASGFSQNELSVEVLDYLGSSVHASDPIVYLINKSEDVDTILDNAESFLHASAKIIWKRCNGLFSEIMVDDFYKERLKTYYSNGYVCPEQYLLDVGIKNNSSLKTGRSSVLPRICQLPMSFRMAVIGAKHWTRECGRNSFLITVSTPEKRHHKHKEFSGKLRAIRYNFDKNFGLANSNTDFFAVIDGYWTEDQIAMLCAAGWFVYDWDSFLEWVILNP